MKLELIRSTIREIVERESGKTIHETEITEYIYRAELEFIRSVVSILGAETDKLSFILNEMTETERVEETSGTYPMPVSAGIPENIIIIRSSAHRASAVTFYDSTPRVTVPGPQLTKVSAV